MTCRSLYGQSELNSCLQFLNLYDVELHKTCSFSFCRTSINGDLKTVPSTNGVHVTKYLFYKSLTGLKTINLCLPCIA